MFWRILLLMTVVPAAELYLLITLGRWIGALETVAIILVTGGIGAFLAKREGLAVIRQLRDDARKGIPPASRLVEGLLVLVGGALLITPGVLTDLAGFTMILPPTRRWLAPRIKDWAAKKITVGPGVDGSGVDVKVGPLREGPAVRETRERFDHPIR